MESNFKNVIPASSIQLVKECATLYGTPSDFEQFETAKLPQNTTGGIQAEKKSCFDNAYKLVLSDPIRFRYCICYIFVKSLPIEHAVVFDTTTGLYYDPTFPSSKSRCILIMKLKVDDLFLMVEQFKTAPDFYSLSKHTKSLANHT